MADFITIDRYASRNLRHRSFFNPLLGLSRDTYILGGAKERFQDIFFAVRGQKTLDRELDGSIHPLARLNYISADSKKGDKLGFSDYGLLMLPYALKVATNFLLILTVGMASDNDVKMPLRVLCGFLAVPACALALSLQIVSSMLDLVKNLIAVTVAALLVLPLTLHANYLKSKEPSYVELGSDHTSRNPYSEDTSSSSLMSAKF